MSAQTLCPTTPVPLAAIVRFPSGTPPEPADLERWFLREIDPPRRLLQAWPGRRFPGLRDGEDIVQEACLRGWRRHRDRPIACPRAFLFRAAGRLAIDALRRERSSPLRTGEPETLAGIVDESAGVAEHACRHQEIKHLHRAIATPRQRCREIFVLRKLHGRSQREIALELRLSEQTVQGQAHRGLRHCGEILTRDGCLGRAA